VAVQAVGTSTSHGVRLAVISPAVVRARRAVDVTRLGLVCPPRTTWTYSSTYTVGKLVSHSNTTNRYSADIAVVYLLKNCLFVKRH